MHNLKYKIIFFTSIVILSFISSCKNSTINNSDTFFKVTDTNSVDKIVLIKNKDTLILTKNENSWIVNNRFTVLSQKIQRALLTLNLIEMNAPLPENAIEKINNEIKDELLITVWSKRKKLKQYYLGKYIPKSGNYIMLFNSKTPYLAHVQGHDFDLRTNFPLSQKKWQGKTIFSDEINSICQVFYKDSQNQFFLSRIDTDFYISHDLNSSKKKIDISEKVNLYLSYFRNVKFDSFLDDYSQKSLDSFLNSDFEFKIILKYSQNIEIEFCAYPLVKNGEKNKNYFIGIINKKDIILAKYYDFDLLRKNYNYFIND